MDTEEIKNKILSRRTTNKRRAELLRQYACMVYLPLFHKNREMVHDYMIQYECDAKLIDDRTGDSIRLGLGVIQISREMWPHYFWF
jgi:hypothetical protein